jgi:signal transduction histidine kinase
MSGHKSKQHFSLAARVSCLLVLAAILPLLITVVIIELFSRPTLINQASTSMETDAKTRTQLIDSYFAERILASETVSRLMPIQKFLAGETSFKEAARESLATGQVRGSHYQNWSLFDVHGQLCLYYPTIPQRHGAFFILPNMLQQLQTSKRTLISDVFYNPVSNEASIDVYAPVITTSYTMVGVLRTTFDLRYIWSIVNEEAGANGSGSYAFILDENGVYIAATNPHPDPEEMTHSLLLFTSVAPLSPALQQRIKREHLYGSDGKTSVSVLVEPPLVQRNMTPTTFQMMPTGQHEMFQVARWKTYTVPWTYLVVSPMSTVTFVADQQEQITRVIAAVILLLTVLLGVIAGRHFALPIMRSIEEQQRAYEHQQHLTQLKDQFLINVSHELRTPLTEMYGYLELLLEYEERLDVAGRTTFLKHAMSGCEELTLLINNVLDAIHLDKETKPPCVQSLSVAQIVTDVLAQFDPRTLHNYDIQVHVAEALHVKADPQYVRQVLRNLLSNAYKYTPKQTQVVVSTRLENTTQQTGHSCQQVTICVKDQGPGIDPDDIPLLFEKFVRLKRDLSGPVRGTGLGLYISKQLVEAMKGQIWVESSGVAGQGSCFCFTLPVVPDEEEAQQRRKRGVSSSYDHFPQRQPHSSRRPTG